MFATYTRLSQLIRLWLASQFSCHLQCGPDLCASNFHKIATQLTALRTTIRGDT